MTPPRAPGLKPRRRWLHEVQDALTFREVREGLVIALFWLLVLGWCLAILWTPLTVLWEMR